ncbi:MAG: hypothetical protein JSV79_02895 [Armatimonadota bacterium]|nr:MAG: hypothetical protein JSV79_02895 [Armatimonadota bacterium]
MADRALNSRDCGTQVRPSEWLFTPFRYVAGGTSLALGLGAIVVAGLLGALSKTHFDGVLDVHTGRPSPTIWLYPAEGLIDWAALAVVLFVVGKVVSRTAFRAVDLFGTQAMARWPMVIVTLATLAPPYQRYSDYVGYKLSRLEGWMRSPSSDALVSSDVIVFGLVVLVMILAAVWMVALMYRSYAVCCNLRGGRAIGSFIAGLILAEAISKLAIAKVWNIL